MIPWFTLQGQRTQFLEVAIHGRSSRTTLEPDQQRTIGELFHLGSGVVQPPEHVRSLAHFDEAPVLLSGTVAITGYWWEEKQK